MNIHKATESFETWVAKHIQIVRPDLELKHEQMAASVFSFFRATFYRWLQLWEEVCSNLTGAPELLAVGDLHVENFGTWRDIEGRLIWGINDFDEVYPMPYTIDLVRLVTSAHLAIGEEHLAMAREGRAMQFGKATRMRSSPAGALLFWASITDGFASSR